MRDKRESAHGFRKEELGCRVFSFRLGIRAMIGESFWVFWLGMHFFFWRRRTREAGGGMMRALRVEAENYQAEEEQRECRVWEVTHFSSHEECSMHCCGTHARCT